MYIYIVIVATLQIYTFLILSKLSNFGAWMCKFDTLCSHFLNLYYIDNHSSFFVYYYLHKEGDKEKEKDDFFLESTYGIRSDDSSKNVLTLYDKLTN